MWETNGFQLQQLVLQAIIALAIIAAVLILILICIIRERGSWARALRSSTLLVKSNLRCDVQTQAHVSQILAGELMDEKAACSERDQHLQAISSAQSSWTGTAPAERNKH